MFRFAFYQLLIVGAAATVVGSELEESVVRTLEEFATTYDGMIVDVQRFHDGESTPTLTATVTFKRDHILANFTYSNDAPSVEVVRPDGYFRLSKDRSRDQWIPVKLSRSAPPFPIVVPELASPFGVDGIPLFVPPTMRKHAMRQKRHGELEWIDGKVPGRHGKVVFTDWGPISRGTSTLDGRGSLTYSLTYVEDETGVKRLVEYRSQGTDGGTTTTVLAWRRDLDESMAPFFLDYYDLSEALLGPNSAIQPGFSLAHLLMLLGAVLVVCLVLHSLRKKRDILAG